MNLTQTTQRTLSTAISHVATNSHLTTSLQQGTEAPENNTDKYNLVLLVIYILVLIVGTFSLSLMLHFSKSGATSATSVVVLNLIFAHFIFLLTVPFRIYYYSTAKWSLGNGWCKVVSSMIHIHMYMSFILYVIILVTRLMMFYHKAGQLASPPRIYAFLLSATMWMLVFVMITCIIHFHYGNGVETRPLSNSTNTRAEYCFRFGRNITFAVKVFNYIISMLIIVIAIMLTALQAHVLWVLYCKHRQGCTSQQDFGAQLKSLSFALIMLICFVPYHIFRLFYLEHLEMQDLNEVLLSLTTFNCMDMLTFLGRRTCSVCMPGTSF